MKYDIGTRVTILPTKVPQASDNSDAPDDEVIENCSACWRPWSEYDCNLGEPPRVAWVDDEALSHVALKCACPKV